MFGHPLRMNENTPARKAMKWFFEAPPVNVKKFRGRKRATIITTLNRDIESTKQINNNFTLPYFELIVGLAQHQSKGTQQKTLAESSKNGH